jgi:hypothetical protein
MNQWMNDEMMKDDESKRFADFYQHFAKKCDGSNFYIV